MKIGAQLRVLRKEKDMTLEDLSQKSGVALATLSRMENDKMTGTLDSHNRICKALGVSLVDLYKELEDESKTVESVPKAVRTEHFNHANKAKYELLVSKILDKKIMPLMVKIEAGGSTQKEQNQRGVEKFLYVLSGKLIAEVGDQTYTLSVGDSIYFDASLEHMLKNAGKTGLEAICIISPPAL